MTAEQGFRMAQGLDVLPPKDDQAYPIPCVEWNALKTRISTVSDEPWLFRMVGSLLLGAALSTCLSILFGAYGAKDQERAAIVAWAVVAVTAIAGVLCLVVAHMQSGVKRERASDVVTQMKLIENRFDRSPRPQRTNE